MAVIYTTNEGKLQTVGVYVSRRGIENRGKISGLAKNKKGEMFIIYPASCGEKTCYCAAKALKIKII